MAYLDTEKSKHSAKPNELYKFEGTYANFYYTSGPKEVVYGVDAVGAPVKYKPIAIRRSEINIGTQEDDGNDLTIELSVQNELVKVYGFQNSPPSLTLTIYRYHSLDDVKSYWTGTINDIKIANGLATIRSPSALAAALSTNLPGVFFQSPCNHVLYDKRCKVKYADFSKSVAVLAIDGQQITVASVGNLAGKLVGGEVLLLSGERRMVTRETEISYKPGAAAAIPATLLTINFPFSKIVVGGNVTVAAGCDLAYSGDCKLKFNNNKNFGGFPFIPSDNLFSTGIDASVVPLADNTCLPPIYDGVFLRVRSASPVFQCNPQWSGNRGLIIVDQRPNGPNGKRLFTQSIGATANPGVTEEYEVNNPGLDPRLQGQLLWRLTNYDFNTWTMEYFCEVTGQMGFDIFPSARYCSSWNGPKNANGLGEIEITYSYEGEPERSAGSKEVAGNGGAQWYWSR